MYSKPELDIVFVAFTRLPSESSKRQHKTFFIHSILNNFNEQLWKFTNSIAGAVFSLSFTLAAFRLLVPSKYMSIKTTFTHPHHQCSAGFLCVSVFLSLCLCMRVNIYIYISRKPNRINNGNVYKRNKEKRFSRS